MEAGLGRTSVYAPTDGIVNQINFLTSNAVVRAGDVLTEIVPFGDDLIVEGKIDPKDIGEIRLGDEVKISLTAYDATKYGRIDGRVLKISADASQISKPVKPPMMSLSQLKVSSMKGTVQKSCCFLG